MRLAIIGIEIEIEIKVTNNEDKRSFFQHVMLDTRVWKLFLALWRKVDPRVYRWV